MFVTTNHVPNVKRFRVRNNFGIGTNTDVCVAHHPAHCPHTGGIILISRKVPRFADQIPTSWFSTRRNHRFDVHKSYIGTRERVFWEINVTSVAIDGHHMRQIPLIALETRQHIVAHTRTVWSRPHTSRWWRRS